MLPYFLALISAFCFGISNAYWKTAGKSNSFSTIVFYRGILASFCFGLIWIFLANSNYNATLIINNGTTTAQYLKTILLCAVCSLGLVFYLLSLRYSAISIAVPLSSINIFSILTAVFILGEAFRSVYFISFALAIAGILISQSFRFDKKGRSWNKGTTYALLASLFWGISYALFKFSASWLGAIPLAFILECCVTITASIWILLSKTKNFIRKEELSANNIKHYLVLATLLVGGTLFFNLAIQQIPVLVINIFGNFTMVVSILAGVLIYREKLSLQQIIGIALVIVSIAIV